MNAVRGQYFQLLVDNRFGGYQLMAIEQAIVVDIYSHLGDGKQAGGLLTEFSYSWQDFKQMCVKIFPKANLDDDDHLSDFLQIVKQIFASDGILVRDSFHAEVTFDFSYDSLNKDK